MSSGCRFLCFKAFSKWSYEVGKSGKRVAKGPMGTFSRNPNPAVVETISQHSCSELTKTNRWLYFRGIFKNLISITYITSNIRRRTQKTCFNSNCYRLWWVRGVPMQFTEGKFNVKKVWFSKGTYRVAQRSQKVPCSLKWQIWQNMCFQRTKKDQSCITVCRVPFL